VVIAMIALLMATLMPAVQQASRRTRAVVCQSRLREWGVGLSIFLNEQEPCVLKTSVDTWNFFWQPYCSGCRDLLLCPIAKHYKVNTSGPYGLGLGSKFTAWKQHTQTPMTVEPGLVLGSYGLNPYALAFLDGRVSRGQRFELSAIPLFLDCVSFCSRADANDRPPAYDGQLIGYDIKNWCIDRHQGAINGLFLDWSVRRVGLKELWGLPWSVRFNRHGRWTKAGGVRPEDWPQWMRTFKDY
jgi:prepilin-type processing-associated H-X9-DG protein